VRPIFSARDPSVTLTISSPLFGTAVETGVKVDNNTKSKTSEIVARIILFSGPAVRTALFSFSVALDNPSLSRLTKAPTGIKSTKAIPVDSTFIP
jgi:hypothetical protein